MIIDPSVPQIAIGLTALVAGGGVFGAWNRSMRKAREGGTEKGIVIEKLDGILKIQGEQGADLKGLALDMAVVKTTTQQHTVAIKNLDRKIENGRPKP